MVLLLRFCSMKISQEIRDECLLAVGGCHLLRDGHAYGFSTDGATGHFGDAGPCPMSTDRNSTEGHHGEMLHTDAELIALLHRLDDPQALELPPGYDHIETRARFDRLVAGLDTAFSTQCQADRNVQDASLHGRVEIPPAATGLGEQIVVSVSNFGSMAAIAAENPGIYLDTTEAVEEGALAADDLTTVERVLVRLGYVVLPERLLTRPYDGVSALASYYGEGQPCDWWIRYFDYL